MLHGLDWEEWPTGEPAEKPALPVAPAHAHCPEHRPYRAAPTALRDRAEPGACGASIR